MKEIVLSIPTKIYFGTNITEKALQESAKWLKGNIMIVTTGRSLKRLGYLEQLMQSLKKIQTVEEVIVFEEISRNPRLEEAEKAVLLGKQKNVTAVIGFGGGSALDAAKAVAVGIATEDNLEEYLLKGKEPDENTLPIIAIPTTAGTGSELSKGAILTSLTHGVKSGIRGKNILPKAAIVDPAYTISIPCKITMETGFDVLAHAVETYMAVKADMFSEMLSEKVIRIVAENLPKLWDDLEDSEAREQMSFASMLMGLNLANIGTCLPHRIQYAIGAKTDTSHAAGLCALYPAWIEKEYSVNAKKVTNVLAWMGYSQVNDGAGAGKCMAEFLERFDLRYKLSELGVEESDLDEMAGKVTGNLANDKLAQAENIVEKLLKES